MNKKNKILISLAIIILLLIIGVIVIKATKLERTAGITVVPTMSDKITTDSSWCGTFQLVWNDMKNNVVKKDIIFDPQKEMVENLNKEEFNENMISDEYYYKAYGLKTLKLKEEIEEGVKEKFNQESDILDKIDWSEDELDNPNDPNTDRYFFYTMLYRKFEFMQEFETLENGKFGNKYDDIEYFGINDNSEKSAREQINVLYYNSKNDFAIIINTKTDDEVIFCKNPKGKTFNKIYENMNKKADKYTSNKEFKSIDKFKAPKLMFEMEKEYTELEGEEFETVNGVGKIEKAIQTIEFNLDEKGGEIKSEAAIDMMDTTSMRMESEEEPRYFYLDDTFTIFLREKGKSLPYFAGRVEDITKFQ